MKVLCIADCYHKQIMFKADRVYTVSDLNQIPGQHFATLSGLPLGQVVRGKDDVKSFEWNVDPKTGKPLKAGAGSTESEKAELTVEQIKEQLDGLGVMYDAKLKKPALQELLDEELEDALSE